MVNVLIHLDTFVNDEGDVRWKVYLSREAGAVPVPLFRVDGIKAKSADEAVSALADALSRAADGAQKVAS